MNSIENTLECPICLEELDLEAGDFLELECCKNKGHIKCLENWIKVNKSDGKCYYCQQNNNYFKSPESSARETIEFNHNIIITNINNNNNNFKKICTGVFYFCILTCTLIIIFCLI